MSAGRIALIVLAVVLLVVAIAGIGWWNDYTQSPRYSLARLALALNEGDWQEAQVYLDADAVSEDIANRVVEERLGDSGIDLGGFGEQLAEAAKPAIAEEIERRMQQEVERREGRSGMREQIGAMWYTRDPERLDIEGDTADVTVRLPVGGQEREFDLQMERAGDLWRVVRIDNAEELLGGL